MVVVLILKGGGTHSKGTHSKCSTENFGKQILILSYSSQLYIYIYTHTIVRDKYPIKMGYIRYISLYHMVIHSENPHDFCISNDILLFGDSHYG